MGKAVADAKVDGYIFFEPVEGVEFGIGGTGTDSYTEGYYATGQTLSLSEGTYTLVLNDDYGDGWIWNGIYGSVTVSDSEGGVLLDLAWDDNNADYSLTGTFTVAIVTTTTITTATTTTTNNNNNNSNNNSTNTNTNNNMQQHATRTQQ